MVTTIQFSAVERLINEFNYPSTSNTRKHEIEKQLIEFQNSPSSWAECLFQLAQTSNQFLWFFNVSTIEAAITRRWKYLDKDDRARLRDTLWANYVNMWPTTVPRLQREKIAQLIALIGKREFPQQHPSYMCHVVELLKTHFNLGITLLRTTSEEVVSTRDDISSDRKKEFHSSLSMCMLEVLQILTQYLIIFNVHVHGGDLTLIPNNSVDPKLIEALPKDNRLSAPTVELLNCIQHLFSWVSLDELVSEQFLFNLFELGKWNQTYYEVSVAALTTISELFYRQRALPLPIIIANGMKNILQQPNLGTSNEMYQDKLTELLRLFTAQQSTKLTEDEVFFPDFVQALYAYTFSGYGALVFTEKLKIWNPIIKGLQNHGLGRYTNCLVTGILRKIQFRYDPELKELDNENLDDDMETDWQHYLTQCIETLASIAEIRPTEVFNQVFAEWQKPFEIFGSLEKSIDANGTLVLDDNARCQLVHCAFLRDLSSLCQTLTRLIPALQGCFQDAPENVILITHYLIYIIKFITANKLHSNSSNSILSSDFIEMFSQALNSIRSLLTWSPILQNENELKSLIENVAQILMPPSNILQEPKIITLASAQLILSITSVLRPRCMLEIPSIKQLIQAGSNLTYLDQKAAATIRQAIVNCFILPWPNVSNPAQEFEKRAFMAQTYISNLAQDLLNLDNSSGHDKVDKIAKIVSMVLPNLKDIIDYYQESSSSVKHMLVTAYLPVIAKSMNIFSQFGSLSEGIADCVLNFTHSVIRTLQIQLGTAYIREILDLLLEASTREQLTTNRYKAVDKLLQMLLLVVEQPGNLGLSLLPAILNFALNSVAPQLKQEKLSNQQCDVAAALYSLFDGILHHRWQYFYKSQVLRGFSPGASDLTMPTEEDLPQHSQQLQAILTAYGEALVNPIDPHITRMVLTSLQSLNDRWKLFSREFFKTNLLPLFLHHLISGVIKPDGILHQDLLISVIYQMGRVNVSALHSSFVSVGYSADARIVEEICLATDLPTFSTKMLQLIQDTKCCQLSQ